MTCWAALFRLERRRLSLLVVAVFLARVDTAERAIESDRDAALKSVQPGGKW